MIDQHCFYHPPPPKSKKPHGLGYGMLTVNISLVNTIHYSGRSTSLSHSIDQTGTRHINDPYARGFSRTSMGNASVSHLSVINTSSNCVL